MVVEGVFHNGVIVPDDAAAFSEGTRVRIVATDNPPSFGQRFAEFKGAAKDLPDDLAEHHNHYRLGTPKR